MLDQHRNSEAGLEATVDAAVGDLPVGSRVVVAMSGGVDSSVAAALMVARGFEVVGVTLRLYDSAAAPRRAGACCAGADIKDAAAVAVKLGIPHYVLDYAERFRRAVIQPFADAYAEGETPVPCIACNRTVKFADLLATARELGAAALITGHYLERRHDGRAVSLHQAADASRDQSYFLFATTREQAEFLRFPLGGLTSKSIVRELAEQFGLAVQDKPDSQDICFVPQGRYDHVVARLRPDAAVAGEIVLQDGTVLGRHDGITGFTVGQRRGLGIAYPEPLFVLGLDPERARVIVGPREALAVTRFMLRDCNWLVEPELLTGEDLTVKIRSTQPALPARLRCHSDASAEVEMAMAALGVAPGQAAVFYRAGRMLGGGFITRAPQPGSATDRPG
ncbi:MAG: tRNA 2-thiouridine(34) synthase MnmA [Alphaproteobacteria bacterium]|nr:tRNA 2-thiouridine(34) synthase MnmA [Alphaproteobacteria bacterium]